MSGLYIHIPFCRSKCYYCDFYSTASSGGMADYADALIAEWKLRRHELTQDVTTIYLGGGTPSLMPLADLERIVKAIEADGVSMDSITEFTLEANPEDINDGNIDGWRSIGINRISIGVQSFDEDKLKAIGRRHSPAASSAAMDILQSSGINYNADLIYGLPGQTLEDFAHDLDRMLQWRPPHMSCYLLSYEPRTRLHAMREKGIISEADEQLATEMYEMLCGRMAATGYRHYEISNFALPGMEARHNSSYWNYTEYLGLGCAAHSFTRMKRRANPTNVKAYVNAMKQGMEFVDVEEETEEERLNDYIITSLRTSAGFCRKFADQIFSARTMCKFNTNLSNLTKMCEQTGALIMKENGDFSISEKMWLRSDAILRELIVD